MNQKNPQRESEGIFKLVVNQEGVTKIRSCGAMQGGRARSVLVHMRARPTPQGAANADFSAGDRRGRGRARERFLPQYPHAHQGFRYRNATQHQQAHGYHLP